MSAQGGGIDHPDEALTTERARLFALLGRLLVAAPDDGLLAALRGLRGDRTPLGESYGALAEAASLADPVKVGREFHDLFIGIGRGELLPFASYYLTGFLHDRPLAELRGDLARLGLERAAGVCEPEDHAGSECEVYAGLLSGSFEGGAPEAEAFFGSICGPGSAGSSRISRPRLRRASTRRRQARARGDGDRGGGPRVAGMREGGGEAR